MEAPEVQPQQAQQSQQLEGGALPPEAAPEVQQLQQLQQQLALQAYQRQLLTQQLLQQQLYAQAGGALAALGLGGAAGAPAAAAAPSVAAALALAQGLAPPALGAPAFGAVPALGAQPALLQAALAAAAAPAGAAALGQQGLLLPQAPVASPEEALQQQSLLGLVPAPIVRPPPPTTPPPPHLEALLRQQQKPAAPTDPTKLFMQGFPAGTTEEQLRSAFGEHGSVTFCKVLPPHPTKPEVACLVRMGTPEEAKWLVENMDRKVPKGFSTPCSIQYSTSTAQGREPKPDSEVAAGAGHPAQVTFPPSEKLWMKGLPPGSSEESIKSAFSTYGTVRFCKLLRSPHPDMQDTACLLRMSTLQEAEFLREKVDGTVPPGMSQPITIRYAASNDRFDAAGAAQQDNVYMKGWPRGTAEETVRRACADFGIVLSCRLLPAPGPDVSDIACLVRMGSPEDARRLVDGLDGRVPAGAATPVTARLAANAGSKPGRGCFRCGQEGHRQADCPLERGAVGGAEAAAAMATMDAGADVVAPPDAEAAASSAEPSKHLRVSGLPEGSTEESLKLVFGAYGCIVTSCRLLPQKPGGADAACLMEVESLDEAKFLADTLDGQIPVGLERPVTIRFADPERERRLLEGPAAPEAKGSWSGQRSSPYAPGGKAPAASDYSQKAWPESSDWTWGSDWSAAGNEETLQVCKWYERGQCYMGNSCKYSHYIPKRTPRKWSSHEGQEGAWGAAPGGGSSGGYWRTPSGAWEDASWGAPAPASGGGAGPVMGALAKARPAAPGPVAPAE